MALFRSSNPTLSEKVFDRSFEQQYTETMSVRGTMNKFGILFLLTLGTAGLAWKMFYSNVDILGYLIGSAVIALIIAVVLYFKMQWASFLAPIYALAKGFAVGAISAVYNHRFDKIAPDIITQAVALTFGVILAMYVLYHFKVIRATETFRSVVVTATLGLAMFYLIAFGLAMFGIRIPFLHEGSTIGIIFSLVVVGLAAMNLILNFDNIEQGAKRGAPKFMEWYCAFGLLVVIVWLYLEILKLLAKLSDRR